jgi:hypothetical protein
MTRLEKIVEFAKSLPVEQQDGLADDLVALMRERNKTISLSPEEIADVQAALLRKNPVFACEAEVLAALGENFS